MKKLTKGAALMLAAVLACASIPAAAAETNLYQVYIVPEMCETRYPVQGTSYLSNAFDNKTTGNKWQDGKKDGWLKIDFETPVKIEQYNVWCAGVNNSVKRATLEVSDSGEDNTWTVIHTINNVDEEGNAIDIDGLTDLVIEKPVYARYYRLNMQDGGTWGTSIVELQMYASEKCNIQGSKVIYDNQNYTWQSVGETSNNIIDGDASTKWSAGGNKDTTQPNTLVIDLGDVYNVKRWIILNGGWIESAATNTAEFNLQYLKYVPGAGSEWETFENRSYYNETTASYATQNISGGITDIYARYIKLNITEGKPNGTVATAYEFQVFGEKLPETKQNMSVAKKLSVTETGELNIEASKNNNNEEASVTVNGDGQAVLSYKAYCNDAYVNYRFAVPEAWDLTDAQGFEFVMSKDEIADSKMRNMQIILEEADGEQYGYKAAMVSEAAEDELVYTLYGDIFTLLNTAVDGVLDLENVKYVNIRYLSNVKDAASITDNTNLFGKNTFKRFSVLTGVPAYVSSFVRYEKAEADGYRDITLTGLEAGTVRISGQVKGLSKTGTDITVTAALYEKTAAGKKLCAVKPVGNVSALKINESYGFELDMDIRTKIARFASLYGILRRKQALFRYAVLLINRQNLK